jgi:TonB family protein
MRLEFSSILLALMGLGCASALQAAALAQDPAADIKAVHYSGGGVTAPELLPLEITIDPPQHCKKFDGTAVLSVVVDSTGHPRDIFFLRPMSTELDRMALNVAVGDGFKPGTADGVPAALAVAVEVKLQACLVEQKNQTGKKLYSLQLRSMPQQQVTVQTAPDQEPEIASSPNHPTDGASLPPGVYHVGGNVTAPKVLNRVEASYSDKGRKEKINGACILSLIVDAHGMPESIQIKRSLEPSLDANAMAAVNRYRFRPAMRNGEPVPVMIVVEVNFKIY